jgi:hypothetical protein
MGPDPVFVAPLTERETMLLGEDPQLGRRVWLWLRPLEEPALTEARRTINRSTRSRWVAGGTSDAWRWDAFLAVEGAPLPALVEKGGRLSWAHTRPILDDLTEELAAACADQTLPARLAANQVWIPPFGRVQLGGPDLDCEAGNLQARALHFLRDVAVLALEGQPRTAAGPAQSMRALVPVHAEQILDRLLGVREPYRAVAELQHDLETTRDRPTEVTPLRRLAHLTLMVGLLNVPFLELVLIFLTSFPGTVPTDALVSPLVYALIALSVGLWIVWALLSRGGFAFHRGGIALRTADSGKPSRLQCGFRAFLIWMPIAILLGLAHYVAGNFPDEGLLARGLWASALLLLLGYGALAVFFPARSLHDWLAGTYLVPE